MGLSLSLILPAQKIPKFRVRNFPLAGKSVQQTPSAMNPPDHASFLRHLLTAEPDLRAFIGSLVRDFQARDDIFQNVALTLWEKYADYDPARPFGAWARGFAARKILHEARGAQRFPAIFPAETLQAILEAYDRSEREATPRREALDHCLEKLPTKTREILALRYNEELSSGGIGLRVGASVAAVHQTLSRARAALAECIERRLAVPTPKH
jgi:RNA polymerase sigma-70 factor, ECF subfamily